MALFRRRPFYFTLLSKENVQSKSESDSIYNIGITFKYCSTQNNVPNTLNKNFKLMLICVQYIDILKYTKQKCIIMLTV